MSQTSNFHHALPAVVSHKSSTSPQTSIGSKATEASAEVDRWVAELKAAYFDDINSLPTKPVSQTSSQPIENNE